MSKFVKLSGLFLSIILVGCANQVLKYDKTEHLKKIDEFDQQVIILTPGAALPTPSDVKKKSSLAKTKVKANSRTKAKTKKGVEPEAVSTKHEPEIEGEAGFIGRRPIKDPYRVSEKIVYDVSYLGMTAGAMTIETLPFVEVNGRKSYQFKMSAQTRSFFSSIYNLDDYVMNLIDYETLIPSVFTLHVRETKQLREARYLFDRSKGQVTFWEKKVTEKDGEKETKLQWETPDFTQNVFSSLIYTRIFPWEVGGEHAFRVADNGQNLIFHAKAIRKEKIKLDSGEFDAIVLNPQVELRGIAKPMGEIYVWLSDDDRHYILKIEGKIKIGTLVFEAQKIDPGLN